jgi:hypothetical protein
MKVGMIPIWDSWGTRHATTVLQLGETQTDTGLETDTGEKRQR